MSFTAEYFRSRSLLRYPIFICLTAIATFGQTSIQDLKPAHAAALEAYLSKNKQNSFRTENILSDEYRKDMNLGMRRRNAPNYVAADLNGDRITDFAVLLQRKGAEVYHDEETRKAGRRDEHFPDYPLTLLVFNGQRRGGFRLAFKEDLTGPLAAFIALTKERRKRIHYGVFETDSDDFFLTPAGRGYIKKYP